jgi:hypothetical protein
MWTWIAVMMGMVLAGPAWSQPGPPFGRGPGGRGFGGAGQDPQFSVDRDIFHFLLGHHEQIRRTVKLRDDGVETLTESDNPEVAAKIQEHVAAMDQRVQQGRPIHLRDPLFAEVFRHAQQIEIEFDNTDKGARVVETSKDPYVAKLIQAHAEVVNLFVKNGFSEPHKNHAVPARVAAGKPADEPRLVATVTACQTCPQAASCPSAKACPKAAAATPACQACPQAANCPSAKACPKAATATPACQACPQAANCPSAKACPKAAAVTPACQACPQAANCPSAKACPQAAAATPACQACPQAANCPSAKACPKADASNPACQVCPQAAKCPAGAALSQLEPDDDGPPPLNLGSEASERE